MSVRNRISLTIVALTLFAAAAFGSLTYRTFFQEQDAQLHALLRQDLERVAAILASPTIGASFVDTKSDEYILQVVTADGRPVMSWGNSTLLPGTPNPQVVSFDGRRYLVAQTAWGSTGGTIRLAHDIEAALQARRELGRNLLLNGIAVILVVTLVGLLTARRQLRLLGTVSAQARSIDPAAPAAIDYGGPQDEIADLVKALNIALGAIRARQDSERAFLLEVAHELAAPLTLVRYHLATVQEEHPGDRRLAAAADAAKELLHSSQDLLVLARGELERPLELQIFQLNDLLHRVQAEYPGIGIRAEVTGQAVGDSQRLMQVVRNLVRNGIQAAGTPGKVLVTLSRERDELVLAVQDEGPGIRKEALERVFEHGFSEHRGVGVGLSVARSLVEQHHGTIRAQSVLGEGSRFEVRLPTLDTRIEPVAAEALAG